MRKSDPLPAEGEGGEAGAEPGEGALVRPGQEKQPSGEALPLTLPSLTCRASPSPSRGEGKNGRAYFGFWPVPGVRASRAGARAPRRVRRLPQSTASESLSTSPSGRSSSRTSLSSSARLSAPSPSVS